jgi:hypothetical protein
MVCHQAVRMHLAIKLHRVRSEGVEVSAVIRFLEEAVAAIVPPLNNMDSDVRDDQARHSRHIRKTARARRG